MPVFLSRAEEKQKETNDLDLSRQKDKQQYNILLSPYLSGHMHAHVGKPAQVMRPVMAKEIKQNEGAAEGKGNLVSMMALEAKVVFCVGLLYVT